MNGDGPRDLPAAGADQPDGTVERAIDWFTHDTESTRQTLDGPNGPISPGALLAAAHDKTRFDLLLPGTQENPAQALIRAQAEWLIRRMPSDHDPPDADSAQQAGRAWGALITPHDEDSPTRDVITEVARRTGMSGRSAGEIIVQARAVSAAYDRADRLTPYDHAPAQDLVEDWHRLVACGPELPEAAAHAQDVLDLLAARLTTTGHDWMAAAAQQAAQLYDSVIQVQPLLASMDSLIPKQDAPDADAGQQRLLELYQQGALTTAATAAARARAVQEWANRDGQPGTTRTRRLEAAGPGLRTLLGLNRALAELDAVGDPSSPTAVSHALTLHTPDGEHIARIVEAIGRLAASARDLRSPAPMTSPDAGSYRPHQGHRPPDMGPTRGTPRAAP
ncbi:hypothetical protein ABZ864_40345 [Streptomyces sp. NPDC047082]|uniref:hypothetical protein n=1 Tax=Streptomyces sp. NPDC047082 TaxID=3155259 RepID=UPI0033DAFEF0